MWRAARFAACHEGRCGDYGEISESPLLGREEIYSTAMGNKESTSTATKLLKGEQDDYSDDAKLSIEEKEAEAKRVSERYRRLTEASTGIFRKYRAAIQEMRVRFEILDDDLEFRYNRNPIHNIEWRLKKPQSVFEKLGRYGKPITLKSMEENILDIAGIRVICSYIDDVYKLVKMLELQDDLEIIKIKDYIKNPKPNGYRSLHIIVKVPIYFLDKKEYVPVEVQFRTIAMDFWASLEHSLKYKQHREYPGIDMFDELKNCSDTIEDVEQRMQILMHAIEDSDADFAKAESLRIKLAQQKNRWREG